jgi:hypothetical protein
MGSINGNENGALPAAAPGSLIAWNFTEYAEDLLDGLDMVISYLLRREPVRPDIC